MADVSRVLADIRAAATDLLAAAERTGPAWSAPRAPGKWSPSQIVEHVARALEESANVVSGAPSKFPTLPGVVRPLVRSLFFNRVLKKKAFPRARTSKAFNPQSGPLTPADGRRRLEAALARFEHECQARAASGRTVTSGIFGEVSVEDYARFQELHTRHHSAQIPGAPAGIA
jgi:hypothetical protein